MAGSKKNKKFPWLAALSVVPSLVKTVGSFFKKTPSKKGKQIAVSGAVTGATAVGLEVLRTQSPEAVEAIERTIQSGPGFPDLPQNWLIALEMILAFLAALLLGKGQGEEEPEVEEE